MSGASLDPTASAYWLVQVRNSEFPAVASAVTTAGAQIAGVVPDSTYIVRATPAQRAQIATSPSVRWSGYYQPAWRVPVAAAGKQSLVDLAGTRTYRVHLFRDDPDLAGAVQALRAIPSATVVADAAPVVDVRATPAQIPAIAAVRAVEWVTVKPTPELLNANARW